MSEAIHTFTDHTHHVNNTSDSAYSAVRRQIQAAESSVNTGGGLSGLNSLGENPGGVRENIPLLDRPASRSLTGGAEAGTAQATTSSGDGVGSVSGSTVGIGSLGAGAALSANTTSASGVDAYKAWKLKNPAGNPSQFFGSLSEEAKRDFAWLWANTNGTNYKAAFSVTDAEMENLHDTISNYEWARKNPNNNFGLVLAALVGIYVVSKGKI